MRRNSIRARVVMWYVGLLAAALLVFGTTLYLGVREYLNASVERALAGEADAIGGTFVGYEQEKGKAWMDAEITEAYAPELSGRFIRVTREPAPGSQAGEVIYESGTTRDGVIVPGKVAAARFDGAAQSFRVLRQAGSSDLMFCSREFVVPNGRRYRIETGVSIAAQQRVLRSVLKIVLLMTPLILLVAAGGSPYLMALPLRPLVRLSEMAEQIGRSQLGERLPVEATGDEMERLALSLNRMIGRLEDALSNNRRFSADVSHELRTPLTIMRGELEQVLQVRGLQDPVRDAVYSSLEEIERMSTIVGNLLTIARLDSGADAIDLLPGDVSALCRWTMEQMHLLAVEKDLQTEMRTVPLQVMVDAARFKQVLVNLMDNAIKYTPEGGSITLCSFVAASGTMAVIEVRDTGIGIPEEALEHVFDRFYRTDGARTRTSGGTGLGLSIVRAICVAHGGTIAVVSTEGAGTTVRVELPLITPVRAAAGMTAGVGAGLSRVLAGQEVLR